MCGDTNSKYFHAQWKIKQSKNPITFVYTDTWIKLIDSTQVESEFIAVFTRLMGTYGGHIPCPNSEVIKIRALLAYGTKMCLDSDSDNRTDRHNN